MPNNVTNVLTIESDNLPELFVFVASDEQAMDFNRIIPMPAILKNTCSGSRSFDGQKVESWWADNSGPYGHPDRKPERLFTPEEEAELEAIGFRDWYDWSVENWGTKWNAYDAEKVEENVLLFRTAWSPPVPVILELSRRFPGVSIRLDFADEFPGGPAGTVTFSDGQIVSFEEGEVGLVEVG